MIKLKDIVVPRLKNWAKESASIFNTRKTELTHFTRNRKKLTSAANALTLRVYGGAVKSKPQLKLLGVILDQSLTYKAHIDYITKKGLSAVLGLKRLRNLRPDTCRQLFTSKVAPLIDYASVIWAPNATQDALKKLDAV